MYSSQPYSSTVPGQQPLGVPHHPHPTQQSTGEGWTVQCPGLEEAPFLWPSSSCDQVPSMSSAVSLNRGRFIWVGRSVMKPALPRFCTAPLV